jgi:hypothetical protein
MSVTMTRLGSWPRWVHPTDRSVSTGLGSNARCAIWPWTTSRNGSTTRPYLERLGQFRADLATVDTTPRGDLLAKRAVQWLRVLADTWVNADVPEARADLLHAIYDRIVVAGRSIVAARLTPAAYSNGLALALPQVVMARPEGFEPPTRLLQT